MGACCGNGRQGQSHSIYFIESQGNFITEYNIHTEEFFLHPVNLQLPAMSKYCEILPDKILITGGFKRLKNRLGEPVSNVWVFEKDLGLVAKDNLSQPRTGHCIVALFGVAYIISGVISHVQPTTECNKYDYFSNTWQRLSPISKPRILAAGCGIGSSIYIAGGNPGNSLQNYRDIEKYNVITDVWEQICVKIPMDIWRHTCLPHKNGLILFGGNGNRSQNLDCFKIDLVDNVIIQQTWLSQGGEFQGCNYGKGESVFAFETSTGRAVWLLSHGKWSCKLNKTVPGSMRKGTI